MQNENLPINAHTCTGWRTSPTNQVKLRCKEYAITIWKGEPRCAKCYAEILRHEKSVKIEKQKRINGVSVSRLTYGNRTYFLTFSCGLSLLNYLGARLLEVRTRERKGERLNEAIRACEGREKEEYERRIEREFSKRVDGRWKKTSSGNYVWREYREGRVPRELFGKGKRG